ncbi:MAG TPA: GNAT family N-acetyltransferase [Fimbriimonadaceae bacterium]|nr:GNAT family N-acetyltransferase [Fimbriimonadaceae bacterium]
MPTIEIRTITSKEADAFLRLLCDVFDLDFSRARSVFFKEPMFDLGRKWALFADGEMVTILTTTPLVFGWGRAFGIAGVATKKQYQRRGYAQRLIETVTEHATKRGETGAMLFAHSESLYRRAGFETIDEVVRGPIVADMVHEPPDPIPYEQIKPIYASWSDEDPARLRRDERRWNYWRWILRTCEIAPGGYVCVEPSLCREAIVTPGLSEWPVMPGSSWLGLESLTKSIGVPLHSSEHDLFVMARGMPVQPQMFMTDQF